MLVNRKLLLLIIALVLGISKLSGQALMNPNAAIVSMVVKNGDTIYKADIQPVTITAKRTFKSKAAERQFWKLVYNVRKVMPYAAIAREKMAKLDDNYRSIEKKKDRSAYAKQVEKELFAEFEGELRELTVTQGRILMRLVDRETGSTTYEIVKEFRGGFQAFFWQGIAKIFGSDLKTTFDPTKGEDKVIEMIIYQIEEGLL